MNDGLEKDTYARRRSKGTEDADTNILPARDLGGFGKSASFTLSNRLIRFSWTVAWTLLARWTPAMMSPWRLFLLRLFGAEVSKTSAVSASARIWFPKNLKLGPFSTLGPGVDCYNMAPIVIGERTVISQRVFLCAGSHNISDPKFQLIARPISIGDDVWIAAEAFVGPGVTVGDGCVISARGCAFSDVEPWTVYRGNPATPIKLRVRRDPREVGVRAP
jgi:putative colanic acid biosynthesis acetyltransferase WcaF